MKQINLIAILLLLTLNVFAQQDESWHDERIILPAELAPFYHGVASGDPAADAVTIWTRAQPDMDAAVSINWYVSTTADPNTFFANIVQQGSVTTDASEDYTAKIRVQNLEPDTWYYYAFQALGNYSVLGRTKTAPTDATNFRAAVASCSNYAFGYYHAYQDMVQRNDLDAIFHLGDYIYEYEDGGFGNLRELAPPYEIVELDNYRARFSLNRLDKDLRQAHQQYPWITTWDDHETTDNSYRTGANNHNPDRAYKPEFDPDAVEGDWLVRLDNAKKAYTEWMPIRVDLGQEPLYRDFDFGNLVDFFFLDTRIEGRDEQTGAIAYSEQDETRTLLGQTQYDWLTNNLMNSTAKWKVIPQQVMMAPFLTTGEQPLNSDQWDGYYPERQRLFNFMEDNAIGNVIVLTGDIHSGWANDLAHERDGNNYVEDTDLVAANNQCERSRGAEFIATGVTSPGILAGNEETVKAANPHVQYLDSKLQGYFVLDVREDRAQADFYTFANVSTPTFTPSVHQENWFLPDGEFCLRQGSESENVDTNPALAPIDVPFAPANDALAIDVLSFAATQKGKTVELNWTIGNDVLAENYAVERSADGTNFTTVGTVKAQRSVTAARYQFTDQQPVKGANYYRLKQFNSDKSTDFSNVLLVNLQSAFTGHQAYPNPAIYQTHLTFFSTISEPLEVELYNAEAKLVKTYQLTATVGQNHLPLDLTDLPEGFYTARVYHTVSQTTGDVRLLKARN